MLTALSPETLALAAAVFGKVAAGLRMALTIFAVASLQNHLHSSVIDVEAAGRARRLNGRAWMLLACSVIAYSPVHTAWLIGHPAPLLLSRLGDVVASGLACAAFVQLFAAQGTARGMSPARVRRGVLANAATAPILIGATLWLTY